MMPWQLTSVLQIISLRLATVDRFEYFPKGTQIFLRSFSAF